MLENPIRTIWTRGGKVANGWLSMPCALSAEVMSHQGYDSLCVDLQHEMIDFSAALSVIRRFRPSDACPRARALPLMRSTLSASSSPQRIKRVGTRDCTA